MSSKSVQQGHFRRRSKLIVSFFVCINLLSFIDLARHFWNENEFDTFPPSSTILQENSQISC